ncbi:MAG: DUF1440 domain-containing protein [Acidobacteria bacterium]|nr:DUF1440 domain-containing protein [Acidobacteriota bacterium]
MTAGARPGFLNLYRGFSDRVQFVSIYVREAHPGENYPHHTSEEQKMRHARDWVEQDEIPWTVAVDTLEGAIHQLYGPVPNSAYLIDRMGQVAFRALWAGQEGLLRDKIEELLEREERNETPVVLGQKENNLIPLIHGAAEFDRTLRRAGHKAREDFRREMGEIPYIIETLASHLRPLLHTEKPEPNVLKGLAAGVIGGLLATFLMTEVQSLWSKVGEEVSSNGDDASGKEDRQQEETPATVKAAQAISKNVFDHQLQKSEEPVAGQIVHYAMGATSGAIYGVTAELAQIVTKGAGVPFGTAVWAIADETLVPVLGLSKSPARYPVSTHVYGLASHFVYGVTTDLVRRGLRSTVLR